MVRKELNLIRKVEKEEKGKPENQGHSVRYDHESRCVFVDDILIDRFKPMFFLRIIQSRICLFCV